MQPHLFLLVRGKSGDDPVDGLGGVKGVQGGHHQVTGLRRGEGGLDRLQVAHFTHQDHVWVLSQRALERLAEGHRVHPDLALVDEGALVANEKLDRVLDGHDVVGLVRVDVVDHRGERGGLSRAGRSRHQNQPALVEGDLLQHQGEQQLPDGQDLDRDHSEDRADRPALLEQVDAKPAQPRHAISQVHLVGSFELVLLELVHDAEGHARDFLRRKTLAVLQRNQRTIDAEHRREARLEMDIRGSPTQRDLQDFVELHGRPTIVAPRVLQGDCAARTKETYRLENWNRRRAPGWPYFLRSTTRASRVKNPAFFIAGRNSGFHTHKARASPWRMAPACPERPPPRTFTVMSTLPACSRTSSGWLITIFDV